MDVGNGQIVLFAIAMAALYGFASARGQAHRNAAVYVRRQKKEQERSVKEAQLAAGSNLAERGY